MVLGINQSFQSYCTELLLTSNKIKQDNPDIDFGVDVIASNTDSYRILTDEEKASIKDDFCNDLNKMINSPLLKANSKEDFGEWLETRLILHSSNDINKNIEYRRLLKDVDIDSEFNKYLESRECKDVEELKALNETCYTSMSQLKFACMNTLRNTLTPIYGSEESAIIASKIINGSNADSLSNYSNKVMFAENEADKYEAAKILIGEYQGDEIDAEGIIQLQRILDSFMKQLEQTIQESNKTQEDYIRGQEEIGWVDFNHYEDKYGDKYKSALTIKYEDLHTYFQKKANAISWAEVSNISSVNVSA